MKIVWIGAGNLATQLGEALHLAVHETLQVFSRTMASAEALAGVEVFSPPEPFITTILALY